MFSTDWCVLLLLFLLLLLLFSRCLFDVVFVLIFCGWMFVIVVSVVLRTWHEANQCNGTSQGGGHGSLHPRAVLQARMYNRARRRRMSNWSVLTWRWRWLVLAGVCLTRKGHRQSWRSKVKVTDKVEGQSWRSKIYILHGHTKPLPAGFEPAHMRSQPRILPLHYHCRYHTLFDLHHTIAIFAIVMVWNW